MSCEGGECKVQIFDVRAKKVKVKETWMYGGGFPRVVQKEPGDKYCKKPTEAQIAEALRRKPIWLSDCPNPEKEKKPPCHCIFTEDDLDPKRGWTRWIQRKVP